jgi:hypothetical protein
MIQTPYQVESFDIVTGKTVTRTITPFPVPQRLRPAKPIGKEELLHDIEDLRTSMAVLLLLSPPRLNPSPDPNLCIVRASFIAACIVRFIGISLPLPETHLNGARTALTTDWPVDLADMLKRSHRGSLLVPANRSRTRSGRLSGCPSGVVATVTSVKISIGGRLVIGRGFY